MEASENLNVDIKSLKYIPITKTKNIEDGMSGTQIVLCKLKCKVHSPYKAGLTKKWPTK